MISLGQELNLKVACSVGETLSLAVVCVFLYCGRSAATPRRVCNRRLHVSCYPRCIYIYRCVVEANTRSIRTLVPSHMHLL